MPGLSDQLHGIEQIPGIISGRLTATSRIKTATVLQLQIFVEPEKIRSTDRTISLRHLLSLVPHIGKRKIKLLGFFVAIFVNI